LPIFRSSNFAILFRRPKVLINWRKDLRSFPDILKIMDAKNYEDVICNPWSWFFAANILYKNANELYDLYTTRHEAILEYFKPDLPKV
jgi:hypothetical protein